jgi:hypothetical protein
MKKYTLKRNLKAGCLWLTLLRRPRSGYSGGWFKASLGKIVPENLS